MMETVVEMTKPAGDQVVLTVMFSLQLLWIEGQAVCCDSAGVKRRRLLDFYFSHFFSSFLSTPFLKILDASVHQ